MSMSKNTNIMIISLNDEYRKMLVNVLSEYDNLDEEMVNDILASWDAKVNEISDSLISILDVKSRKGAKKTGPKRPMSAYLFFCKEKRAEIKEENPDMKATEVTSELGRLWHQVKETDEVEQYNELAKADKERYAAEMVDAPPKEPKEKKQRKKKTVESSDGESKGEPKKKRAAKKPKKTGPKKPKSAYLYFCEEKRSEVKAENPDMKPTEITSELGRLWNKIKDTPRANKYKEQAEDAKAEYAEKNAEVRVENSSGEGGEEEEEEEAPKPKKGKKLPKAKKEEKVPTTGYQLFCKEEGEGVEKKELRKMWLQMKKTDMAKFQDYEIRAKNNSTEADSESEDETEAVILPRMSLNQTQDEAKYEAKIEDESKAESTAESKAEIDEDLESENELQVQIEEEEEDPSLVDTRTLLNYLEGIKGNRPNKDEFIEQVESLENLSSEIKESISRVKKLRNTTITVNVVEKLIVLCNDTIKSYEL